MLHLSRRSLPLPSPLRRLTPRIFLALAAALTALALPLYEAAAQQAGTRDPNFFSGFDGYVYSLALRADGQVMAGGDFGKVDGESRNKVTRLKTTGKLDPSFDDGSLTLNTVKTLALQPDGKLFVVSGLKVVRLNASGTVDTTFNSGVGIDSGSINTLALQGDGKLLVQGGFTTYNGVARNGVARLNPDGSLDDSFVPTTTLQAPSIMALQADGKVLVSGFLRNNADFSTDFYVARLNADGSLDPDFSADAYVKERAYVLLAQTDGKVLVGGVFKVINGQARNDLARLNADGTLDTEFAPVTGINQQVDCLALQGDGKIFVGGHFSTVGGVARGHVARLNTDGSLDPAFGPGSGADTTVNSIVVQPDGKVLLGGNFNSYDGQIVGGNRLVRVFGDAPAHPAFFSGEAAVGGGAYYLQFASSNPFGYYSYLIDERYIYHFDLGYEYVFDAADGKSGVYLYDFKSGSFFYTSPGFPFPYLYDFTLNSALYYYPDTTQADHYTTAPRYFFNFATGQIITK